MVVVTAAVAITEAMADPVVEVQVVHIVLQEEMVLLLKDMQVVVREQIQVEQVIPAEEAVVPFLLGQAHLDLEIREEMEAQD